VTPARRTYRSDAGPRGNEPLKINRLLNVLSCRLNHPVAAPISSQKPAPMGELDSFLAFPRVQPFPLPIILRVHKS
jgi:hypothetical protein